MIHYKEATLQVTPLMAAKWLEGGEGFNRKIRKGQVRKLAAAIARGEMLPAQPILLDEHGVCIDGQHRLTAIIEAGIPIEAVVLRGFPRDTTFEVLDEGTTRKLADKLRGPSATLIAQAGRLCWVLDAKQSGGVFQTDGGANLTGITHTQQLQYIRTIEDELTTADELLPEISDPIIRRSLAVALFVHFARRDQPMARSFLRKLIRGENISGNLLVLRSRLINEAATSGGKRLDQRYRIALIIKTWNAERTGTEIKQLKWNINGGETFPEIE